MDKKNFNYYLATRTLALLDQRKARLELDRTSFYVWQRPDRVVVIFDTTAVDMGKINEDFAHRLSTQLQGRLVVRTNSRGLFLQVGYEIPPMLGDLTPALLMLGEQPTPYDLPMGTIPNGRQMWVSLLAADSLLVSGSRSFGKSALLHGFIQALLHGGAVDVYAFDGKEGVEFSRYIGMEHFHMVWNLGQALAELKTIASARRKKLLASGSPNIIAYNQANPDEPIMPIALFVDEAALTTDEEKAALVQIVERERDTGFYPVLATNRPEAAALLVKTNLVTRICFAVPSFHASQMVLGMNGAESLPKLQGRGLIVYKARVTEFQSFLVSYPYPSEAAVKTMMEERDQVRAENDRLAADPDTDRILELATLGKTAAAIAREMWGETGGRPFYRRRDQVQAVLDQHANTSSTSASSAPVLGSNLGIQGI